MVEYLQRKNLSTCPSWGRRSWEDFRCSWTLLLLVVGVWWTKVSHWLGFWSSGMCEWSWEMGLDWRVRGMWRRVELYWSLVIWEWEEVRVSSGKWKPLKFFAGVEWVLSETGGVYIFLIWNGLETSKPNFKWYMRILLLHE